MNCRAKTAGIELQSWFAVMPCQTCSSLIMYWWMILAASSST